MGSVSIMLSELDPKLVGGDLRRELLAAQARALLRQERRSAGWVTLVASALLAIAVGGLINLARAFGYLPVIDPQTFAGVRGVVLLVTAMLVALLLFWAWRAWVQVTRSRMFLLEMERREMAREAVNAAATPG